MLEHTTGGLSASRSSELRDPILPRGVGRRKPIDAAKEAVTVLDLAERLASEQGKRLTGRGEELSTSCLLPSHEDRSPSFYVNPERNVWYCHGCGQGGDVVHLAASVWGHGDDMVSAAVDLLLTFGHEPPERPPAWFARQERQKPIRSAIAQARFEYLRRRLFRRFFAPTLSRIEDEVEREEESRLLWEATEPLAEMMVARVMGSVR